MTDTQEWWPADWGHYGGLFIRMAWHSAGTTALLTGVAAPAPATSVLHRSTAGPDNCNLDKARRLLWPISRSMETRFPGPTC